MHYGLEAYCVPRFSDLGWDSSQLLQLPVMCAKRVVLSLQFEVLLIKLYFIVSPALWSCKWSYMAHFFNQNNISYFPQFFCVLESRLTGTWLYLSMIELSAIMVVWLYLPLTLFLAILTERPPLEAKEWGQECSHGSCFA